MNRTDRFDDIVSDWLHADADHRVPEHLDAVLLRTRTERQRPAWSSLERWLPMQTTLHLAPVPRVAWLLLVVGLVAAVALAALAVGSRHRQPAPPFGLARNGPILYGGSDNDIYSLDPVTGATAVLITGTASDHSPLLSPDGTRLLFLRDSTTRDQGVGPIQPMLMVANDDGSDIRPITGPLANFASSVGNTAWSHDTVWSHDGTKVAVIAYIDSKPAIQVFKVDGSSAPVVIDTHGLTDIAYLAFRPGNRELTFRGSAPDGVGLFAAGSDGSGYRTIAHVADGDGASLSPDGTKIAYQTWDGTLGVIHVVDVDTGLDSVPAFAPPSTAALVDDTPAWSPDGTRFLFIRYVVGADNHLVVASVTGGSRVEIGPALPNDATGGDYRFSPDGSRVLAHFNTDGSTWLLDPTGSTAGVRLSSTIATAASWQRLAP
jgi:dipeptidyl aminopeptidase/acylaminoacyl peptidase